jgi:hypothetical protein
MMVNQTDQPLFANYQNAETMSYDILRQNAETVLAVSAFQHFGIFGCLPKPSFGSFGSFGKQLNLNC